MTVRRVIITGGGTGIGRACAARFARAGDEVWVTGRRRAPLDEVATDLGVTALSFDASDPEQVATALDHLPSSVDVLVHCAGGVARTPGPESPGEAARLAAVAAEWRASHSANVLTAVLVTAALAGRLVEGARVVAIGSIAARTGAGSYGAAKAALEAWAVGQARALGPRGITVNVVSPGLTEDTEFFGDTMTPARRERLVAETLTGRAGTPDDVAALVTFLASPEAGHVTSQVVPVNGGAQAAR
ncbi:SDR family NAD(P)-dependent oxidoreductase [Oerskovia flava]|uniref:SDR family NAD(P)-dependent oxidoreductase n=1 Tax=Oerskovia flava TaxID=2986422 RepID=UPI002240A8DB|nr:SDR family oxidoreductase [Oerskovia sp. JB1-3-2]